MGKGGETEENKEVEVGGREKGKLEKEERQADYRIISQDGYAFTL